MADYFNSGGDVLERQDQERQNYQRGWCVDELRGVEFGDVRLERRLVELAETLSEFPLSPINQACQKKAKAKAAYRLFANEKVTSEPILSAHQARTCQRMQDEELVFFVEDTTFLDFTSHIKTQGLGPLGGKGGQRSGRGLLMHSALALDGNGVPLGILSQNIWARPLDVDPEKSGLHYAISIEEKESYRWLRSARESFAALWKNAEKVPEVVVLADREADIFEFMEDVLAQFGHFVIRAGSHNRVTIHEGENVRSRAGEALHTLATELEQAPVRGRVKVNVPKRPSSLHSIGQSSREAEVEIKICQPKIALPRRTSIRHRGGKNLDYNESRRQARDRAMDISVIWAKEQHPPKGEEALDWKLLTDLPIESLEDALQVMDWYKLRWRVESFHRVLKSGCRVEDCRLSTIERLKKYLTLNSIIAWRILWMSLLSRDHPDEPCPTVLTESEWKSLYCRVHETNELPEQPPSVYQAMRWIAQLGGFLGRKCDGEPGMTTIWRGWQRLSDLAHAWRIFHPA